jgi:hypothetical protein
VGLVQLADNQVVIGQRREVVQQHPHVVGLGAGRDHQVHFVGRMGGEHLAQLVNLALVGRRAAGGVDQHQVAGPPLGHHLVEFLAAEHDIDVQPHDLGVGAQLLGGRDPVVVEAQADALAGLERNCAASLAIVVVLPTPSRDQRHRAALVACCPA